MGSRRSWITTDIWMDDEFQDASNEEKLLWFYLMTSPLSNSAGFYRLTPNYVELALGKEYADMLKKSNKYYLYDAKSKQVLLPNYLKYNKASSKQQFIAIARSLDNLTTCRLFKDFILSMRKWCGEDGFKYLSEPVKNYIAFLAEKEESERDKIILDSILKLI